MEKPRLRAVKPLSQCHVGPQTQCLTDSQIPILPSYHAALIIVCVQASYLMSQNQFAQLSNINILSTVDVGRNEE